MTRLLARFDPTTTDWLVGITAGSSQFLIFMSRSSSASVLFLFSFSISRCCAASASSTTGKLQNQQLQASRTTTARERLGAVFLTFLRHPAEIFIVCTREETAWCEPFPHQPPPSKRFSMKGYAADSVWLWALDFKDDNTAQRMLNSFALCAIHTWLWLGKFRFSVNFRIGLRC